MTDNNSAEKENKNGVHSRKKRGSKVTFDDTLPTIATPSVGDNKENGKQRAMPAASGHTLSAYVVALRPWSFTATLTPVALGSVLFYKQSDGASLPCIWTLLASCLTVLSVHAAGNLVNTYYDYKKGVDSQKSDDRTLVDHILEPNDVATMGMLCYCFGCVGFVLTVALSPATIEDLAFIFFGGLSSSFLYTGGRLKYIALGDLLILLTFGPLTGLFTYISQDGGLSFLPLMYAIPLALNTEAILHSNNARDMEYDKKSGIITLAILIGEKGSYVFFVFLLFFPYFIFTVLCVNFSKAFALPLVTILLAFSYEREFRNRQLAKMPRKIAKLNLLMGLGYVVAVVLTQKSALPGFS